MVTKSDQHKADARHHIQSTVAEMRMERLWRMVELIVEGRKTLRTPGVRSHSLRVEEKPSEYRSDK